MTLKYTARLLIDKIVISEETGHDLDKLYNWMLVKANGQFGDIHGEIVDNTSGEVVKKFRKSPPD